DFEATWQERNKAEEALKTAFAGMSVDSTREQIRATKEIVLKPFKETVATRKAEKEKQNRDDHKRRMIGIGMSFKLDYVDDYIKELSQDYEIENPISKTYAIRRKLEPVLTAELMKRDMTSEEIKDFIQDYIDDELGVR